MNLLLHDLPDHRLWCGSCITAPALMEDHQLQRFDLVVTEPPFSLSEAEYEEAAKDPWNRFGAGLPSPKRGELVYVQHVAAILNEKGRAAVIVPHGVLFRGGIEGKIRAAMLQPEIDLIEAVIGLPGGLLYATPAPSAILILNRDKPPDRRGKVLFMDAAGLLEKDDFSPAKIAALYHAFGESALVLDKLEGLIREWRTAADLARTAVEELSREIEEKTQLAQAAWQVRQQEIAVAAMAAQKWLADRGSCERCAAVATLEVIAETQGHNLNFARYLSGHAGVQAKNLALELLEIRKLESQRAEIEAEMNRLLQELGPVMRQ
jgi:type I restriction-modification system DNA methylase subunit